jgi:hypothetical protein
VTRRTWIGIAAAAAALSVAGAAWLTHGPATPAPSGGARLPSPGFPGGRPIRAEDVSEGRLAMERLPPEVGAALEQHTAELIRNAEAIEHKQARVTGTCAPGSAIRVIAEDGTVACQRLPRGVISVAALAGVPRLSTTGTAQGTVAGGVGRFQTSGDDDWLVVPVSLPDAAVVVSFSYVFYDADPKVDGTAYLYRSDDQPLAALGTSGAADEVRVVSTEEIHLAKVDASRYAYFVYFQTSAEAGANLVPISASVAYRLP